MQKSAVPNILLFFLPLKKQRYLITAMTFGMIMDRIPFAEDGFELIRVYDKEFILDCIKETILLSVDAKEKELSDLWIDNILMIVSKNLDDAENEAFALMYNNSKAGLLWLGRSNDQFTCEDTGYVLGIYVAPEFRRKGLGRKMLESAELWCKEKGYLYLTLNVGNENDVAKRFYESCGYGVRSTVMRKLV